MAKLPARPAAQRVAVVGAGWAGCAAAVELARAGHDVTVYEAARSLGGRARRVMIEGKTADGASSPALALDNGQHILLGAYSETLRLLKLVGIDTQQALLTLPLQMPYPPGADGMTFIAPRLPAPLHLAGALLTARGLVWQDKMALARFSTTARWMDWTLHTDCSVSELLERFDQTVRLIQLMWRPLCLAALNTPPERASAQVFLNVLRDSLGAKRQASDMLLPRADLGALFPDAAAAYIQQRGATLRTGAKVSALRQDDSGAWLLEINGEETAQFAGVVLATPASQVANLLDFPATAAIRAQIAAFTPEAITTCYLQYAAGVTLERPMFALIDNAASGLWGQFVFDRGQLDASQAGLLAVVVSASAAAAELGQADLAAAIAAQLATAFGRPELASPAWTQVITDKRATFACTPGLVRPGNASGLHGLALAGDYTASDYPATIEAAMRSGVKAAAALWPDGTKGRTGKVGTIGTVGTTGQ